MTANGPVHDGTTMKRQRNRRGEGAKLRGMIIDAARGLLEDDGSETAVTIRAVTRRAGIAPQSFYLQFESLDALLFALYEQAFDGLHGAFHDALAPLVDPDARLRAVTCTYPADNTPLSAAICARRCAASDRRVASSW